MARGISFAKTLPQLLAGQKTCTRRNWKIRTVGTFNRYFSEGIIIPALTKDLRADGEIIGWLILTQKPYQERLGDMPLEDVAAEGFPELSRTEFIDKFFEGKADQLVWVVRFKFML